MPYGSVQLVPGVNVERTPMLLRAGVSQSSLIRYRDSLVQKLGGWSKYFRYALSGVPRDLHAWQDLSNDDILGCGTTTELSVISGGVKSTVTPQTLTSNFAPNLSTTASSNAVAITDPNVTNVTIYDSVFFNTPVSIGGMILDGLYPISLITGTHAYDITAGSAATVSETNPTVTNGTTAAGNAVLHFASVPSWVTAGMLVYNLTTPASIAAGTQVSTTGVGTVTMNANAAAPGVGSGDSIIFASLPIFTTTNGSSVVTVKFIAHGVAAGDTAVFQAATTGGGVTIQGAYKALSVIDANQFTIQIDSLATSGSTFPMNGGNLNLTYYIALGPTTPGTGYGLGNYGAGNYGYGTGSGSSQTGSPITATDWTLDNWGALLVAVPSGGPVYYWDPSSGFQNASIIVTGPVFNNGAFISNAAQILVTFGSSVHEAIGYQQQPLLVQWCDAAGLFSWTPSANSQAGNFPLPFGSTIVAGMAVSNQNLLWTDLDLWAMAYIGPPDVYGFNTIGAGMGAASAHAVQKLRGSVFWMGPTNFFSYTGGGANVVPCPVWDAVFQNLNTSYLQNIRAMPNTAYNEVGWLYPSAASSSGECDSYVKFNISEPGGPWDIGPMSRSAWIDQSVLGMPIGASPQGFIYQHDVSPNADNVPLLSGFTTGFFYLAEGEDYVFVDQVIPDFKWGDYGAAQTAQIQMTFHVCNYPGDATTDYGPYTVTVATEFIPVRFRGRLMAITIASSDLGSFWRIGSIKYRWAPAGRR